MNVNGLNSLLNAVNGTAEDSRQELAGDFDKFLQLLTTQLKHQDPMEPTDVEEFTNQLVQFATVEQNIKTNDNLEKLMVAQAVNGAVGMVNFVGKVVEMDQDALPLIGGQSSFAYKFDGVPDQVFITIRDESGAIVRQVAGDTSAGKHQVVWDGTDDAGETLPDGVYTVSVVAQDEEDNALPTEVTTFGRVLSVNSIGNDTTFGFGPFEASVDNLVSVHE